MKELELFLKDGLTEPRETASYPYIEYSPKQNRSSQLIRSLFLLPFEFLEVSWLFDDVQEI